MKKELTKTQKRRRRDQAEESFQKKILAKPEVTMGPEKKLRTLKDKLNQSIETVQAWLLAESLRRNPVDFGSKKKFEVKLECWETNPHNTHIGFRVAEVSFVVKPIDGSVVGMGGCSFMQSDPDGLKVCALAERLVLEISFMANETVDDTDMIREQLFHAVFGEEKPK